MKRINLLSMAILAAAALLVGASSAYAADVSLPSGDYPFVTLATGGVYEVSGNLTLESGAKIHCNDNATDQPPGPVAGNDSACPITIIVHGDLLMQAGSAIQAENLVSGGDGGNISITVDGNVLMKGGVPAGALISSRKLSGAGDTGVGGNITIHAGQTDCTVFQDKGDVTVEIGAQVLADSPGNPGDIEILSGRFITISGKVSSRNTTTFGRAGRITIIACCDLQVTATGIVSSRGQDPGADLVHLEGCSVEIAGLVESTGPGHTDGQGAIGSNACNDPNHVAPAGASFRACVEIWSGSTVLIDASGLNHGQINADTAQSGGTTGRGWIDIYANGDITITGNSSVLAPFAVHANQFVTDAHGGVITIKSKGGNVAATDFAVQADAKNGGGSGGQLVVEALAINLGNASLYARGDFVQTGGFGWGGTINARAFTGALTWPNGTGDVRPTGADTITPVDVDAPSAASGKRGVITFKYCTTFSTGTTAFPFNGNLATTPSPAVQDCGLLSPTIPDPAGAALLARFNCLDNNCTSHLPPPPFFCEKEPVQDILDPVNGRFPLNQGPDHVVRVDLGESIQAELDKAALPGYDASHNNDGYIIIAVSAHADGSLGGNTSQGADINGQYEWPFALFGCSVTMHGPVAGGAVGHIEQGATSPENPPLSGQNIFIMDLHAADGTTGWFVEGNGRYVRNTYGTTSGTGVWIKGNNNTMHNGKAEANTGIGLKVEGNGNTVDSTDSFSNGGDGVNVSGNSNTLDGIDTGDKGKGNLGNGLNLLGNSNLINEVDAYANKGWGFIVNGTLNTLDSNTAGDKGDKANGKGGFLLTGTGSVLENTAIGNLGGALNPKLGDGFKFTTSGFSLSKNISGGTGSGTPNTGCQFNFTVAGNLDAGGNKSKGAAIAGAGTPKAFPVSCK